MSPTKSPQSLPVGRKPGNWDPGELFAIERLVSEGLRGDVARDLVARHGSERCLHYADALISQRGIRSRPGWLRRAIEEGYELPDTLPIPETSADAPVPALPERSADDEQEAPSKEPQHVPEASLSQEAADDGPSSAPAPDPQAIAAWEALVSDLTALRGEDCLPPWFDQLAGGDLQGSTLTVLVPNTTAANHLNDHFGNDLVRLWRERTGVDALVQVATDLQSGKRAALTG